MGVIANGFAHSGNLAWLRAWLRCRVKGSMPPCIDHMELLAWMQRADFSEHIQRFKLHGNPLNYPHFDAPNTKFAPTGYRRAPNIISHHYKQQLSAKASIIPKARPIRFRYNGSSTLSAAQNSHKCHMRAKFNITRYSNTASAFVYF